MPKPDPGKKRAASRVKPGTALDDTLAFRSVVGDFTPEDHLLRLICERIQAAAKHLGLSRAHLFKIFSRYSMFEGEATASLDGKDHKFLIVEAHHLMQGKVGKGALKLVFPKDLVWESDVFVEVAPGVIEVLPPLPKPRWYEREEAWEHVSGFLRELITGETLSMSLKSQATGTPFAGSEGVILCAVDEYEDASGRFLLKSVLSNSGNGKERDKELLEAIVNSTAAVLTRAGRIAHDRIVHAAETNSTLTSRLDLQLPTNVVEGHLRALLHDDPNILIGDEDMTARLRKILARADYQPTDCILAEEAAGMQLNHSIITLSTRERLRGVLAALPFEGQPQPGQFREVVGIFYGSGETQQAEDQIFHHREPILRSLSAALSAGRLDECEDAGVLARYLQVLLDNQEKLMKAALLRHMPPDEALSVDWFETLPLLSTQQELKLAALRPKLETSRSEVKQNFVRVLEILTAARKAASADPDDLYLAAREEVLTQAIRAITRGEGILPSVERIRFFTTPFTYECVTPKLGVVTRKPRSVCGSELRPEAMAAGAVFALEALRKMQRAPKSKPLAGLTVAIQGLGNAGKGVATMMRDRGAKIVAVSDSRGALLAPEGLKDPQLKALLEHKSAGKSLDTFAGPGLEGTAPRPPPSGASFHANPDVLKTVRADVLVLTAMAGSINRDDADGLEFKMICELTGAAVTGDAKKVLRERGIDVIPDNLSSSGGLLVSLSEMLQNSLGQQWDRTLEETILRQQIEQSHDVIRKTAEKHGVDMAAASDILALKRIHDLAVYRENLEAAAQKLKQQIQAVHDGETVVIASDNDDDGVASAAMLDTLIACLNPGREKQILHINESLRSPAMIEVIESRSETGSSVKRVFVLDRAFPLTREGQQVATEIARRHSLILINNHDLPEPIAGLEGQGHATADSSGLLPPTALGVLLISPQTLKSTTPRRHLTTALVLREIAHQLIPESPARTQLDWQAALGSWLDIAPETNNEWLLFSAQFNPDLMTEAARAVRTVARARDFESAVRAVRSVERPDQLETNVPWEEFMRMYRLLDERVQLLVEKIVMENVRRPYVAHFFTRAEAASPFPPTAEARHYLDLYPWISEHVTNRSDFSEKPIIVGQIVEDVRGREFLGVRIRSPRGVELMEAGLPDHFRTGGLPNTAVAEIALDDARMADQQFHNLVEDIWWKTVSPTVTLRRARSKA